MNPRSAVLAILLGGVPGLASAQASGAGCPERPASGSIGLLALHCVSGACTVNDRDKAGYYHTFTVEPRIAGLDAGVPAARQLRVGDAIVAIDSVPISTREGGRHLASLEAGKPVHLLLRRGTHLVEVVLTPVRGCNAPTLVVRSQ